MEHDFHFVNYVIDIPREPITTDDLSSINVSELEREDYVNMANYLQKMIRQDWPNEPDSLPVPEVGLILFRHLPEALNMVKNGYNYDE